MPTKKRSETVVDDLRPEYDVGELGKPVRGKYAKRAAEGTNLVLLEPDIAKAFPTAESVNNALRMLVDVAAVLSEKKKQPHR